jgi:hypothetical protein
MFFSSTYSTQRGELLISFCNGNLTQNSSPSGIKNGDHLSPILRFALRNSLLTGLIAERFLVVHILHSAVSY